MRYVYADNSATTALSPKVLEKMMPYLTEVYGNPSSIYTIGAKAKAAVETARENIAKNLGAANPNEIYFTSGGSESDNWALKGVCHALKAKGKKHIITSKFEHHAILHTCEALEKEGFEVTYLDVYENGIVHPEDVENAIREDTAIVSIMYANNEIGTIQPISEIGAICRKHGVLFHTDAVQAAGYVKIDVQKENIDLLSMTAHKLHGPKGCGLLYIRKGVRIENLICGGAQERNKRAGTENVAGIIGLDAALQLAVDGMDERNAKLEKMRDRLIDGLLKIERSRINGDRVLLVHRAVLIQAMCFLQSVFRTRLPTAVCVFRSLTTTQRKTLITFLKSFPKLFHTSEVCHPFGKRLKSRKLKADWQPVKIHIELNRYSVTTGGLKWLIRKK